MRIRREKTRPLLPIVMLNGFQTPGMFYPGRDLRPRPQQQPQPVAGPRRRERPAHVAARRARVRQPRADQGAARRAVAGDHRPPQRPGHGGGRREPGPGAGPVGGGPGRSRPTAPSAPAIITFNGHLEGLEQTRRLENVLVLTFRPQEAVYSLEQLNVVVQRVLHHGRRLQPGAVRAVPRAGLPGREVARLRTAGEVMPVDTAGPATCRRSATGRRRPPDERRQGQRRASGPERTQSRGTRR